MNGFEPNRPNARVEIKNMNLFVKDIFIRNSIKQIQRGMSTKFIATHDGTFHCDDVTACFILKQLDRFRNHDILRTRDTERLAKAEIVVDVGSELDVKKLRLDHHQRTFNQTIKDYHPYIKTTNPNKPPRLSSSGLVFAIFGKELIKKVLGLNHESDLMVDAIYERAYVEFFEEIDAIDNGIEVVQGDDVVYNYHINTDLSTRVARLNPLEKDATPDMRMERFLKAMELVGEELLQGLKFLGEVWWPRREVFRTYVEERMEIDPSGQIVYLKDEKIGWKSSLFDLEEKLGIVGQLKYVVFSENSDVSPWRAVAIPVTLKSFTSRIPLKEEWRGKRDEELQEVSGIPEASFVHMSGFTGGAKTLSGILSMIRLTLGLKGK